MVDADGGTVALQRQGSGGLRLRRAGGSRSGRSLGGDPPARRRRRADRGRSRRPSACCFVARRPGVHRRDRRARTGSSCCQPNQAAVLTLLGRYRGTVRSDGWWWVNPLMLHKKISLRVRTFDSDTLKVNDAVGNPIEIASVINWLVADTAKAAFDVEDYEAFVEIQTEGAVRHVASAYPRRRLRGGQPPLRANADEGRPPLQAELASNGCRSPASPCSTPGCGGWPTPPRSPARCCGASRPTPSSPPERSSSTAPSAWSSTPSRCSTSGAWSTLDE